VCEMDRTPGLTIVHIIWATRSGRSSVLDRVAG
jgi:hypothetical protein